MDEHSANFNDRHHPMEPPWIPSTPAKPGLGNESIPSVFNGFANVPLQNLLGHVMAGGTIKDLQSGIIHPALNGESWCGLETSPNFPLETRIQGANAMGSLFPYDLNTSPNTVAYASTAGISSHFEPITPDQTKKIDEEKSNLCMSVAAEVQNNQSELVENQTSATITSITGENFGPEIVLHGQTDPSRTPATKSRRKKHRPKVIVEGQSKRSSNPRTPKPAGTPKRKYVRKSTACQSVNVPLEARTNGEVEATKPPGSEDMPRTKRKYVRRKKVDPTTPLEDGTTATTDSIAARVARRSCKKSLNFDNESEVQEGNFSQPPSDIDPRCSQQKEVVVEKTQADVACDLLVKASQGPCTSTSCMSSQFSAQNQTQSIRGKCRIVFSDVTHDDPANIFATMASTVSWATGNSSNSKYCSSTSMSQETEAMNSKRRRCSATDALEYCNINASGSHYNSLQAYQKILMPDEYNGIATSNMYFPPIHKKKRSETCHQSASFSILPPSISCEYCIYPSDEKAFPSYPAVETNVNTSKCLPTLGSTGRITKKRSKGITRVRNFHPVLKRSRKLPTSSNGMRTTKASLGPQTCMEALADISATLARKKRSNRVFICSSSIANKHYESAAHLIAIQTGSSPGTSAIDAIVEKFNCLSIEEGSLVVYQNNGTMVPFDGTFNNIRKRRPRPKVDLDDETTRVWKLLLEDINSEGIDGNDQQKAKQWEEEREVFRLRTESFIARMHLVQGDRRFTPWKGSVLDSVIGVFLTQNVSDHLSSSAFISMAARFPPNHNTQLFKKRSEGPGVLDPSDTMEWNKKVSSPLAGIDYSLTLHNNKYSEEINTTFPGNTSGGTHTIHPSSLSSVISECGAKYNEPDVNKFVSQNKEMLASFNGDQKEPDVISSQNSVVSPHNSIESIGQTANRSESCSQSSSETEPTDTASGFTTFLELLQRTETISHGIYSQGCRKTSSYYETPTKSEGSMPYHFRGVNLGCHEINTSGDGGFFGIFKETDLSATEQSGSSPESSAGTSSQSSLSLNHQIQNEERETELVSTVQKQETHRIYEGSNAPSSSESDFNHSGKKLTLERERDQKAVESNLKDSSNFGDKADEINASTSKAKRKKINGKEKKDAVDWDTLRKEALANGKRERTVETMDSVDWEAVRCADVKEIADTIKERGMNNMLAERIKDFLNRMVREHESIDLEWLRDIQPDRAKDFLLSIRGLGLKSVECVRLLTLHHLAFPVDTNVGRIAVRLGWVPLQPLPESLQLHLLELYPVLESIQKYLWPRLCKLDQPTLYELHYQLITFGKVFCTKNKPNCNACPMRAECRHFASAYASARLALPAPEEKSINHLQLTQPEVNQHLVASSEIRSLGPIIEEPATPEPVIEEPETPEPERIQVPEIDIEDSLREDTAEIPTIKLNLEELNQTLQNYIEKNIQVQEGEMSKALVVVDAAAASIPMPKLKSVNRLRTEHQVYELPDTHPLLQGFDRREQDDPSHYLLAIWTPGETVDSIQPPESTCSFQDSGKLCDQPTCFSCNSIREANTQTVRGTILIPCRTAMRGSFPLNGTYFQVNEMFADHESSLNPIDVPRDWLWNLPRRTVYFGTSIPTIFKGLSQPAIQYCFWKGFVCVRGFERKTRAPRPLVARLHFPASKLMRTRGRTDE